MYFTLTAERQDGERLTLTQYRSAFQATYAGFGPVAANVATAARGMQDGNKITSKRRGGRNPVITVYIRGNVEENRIRLYSFFTPGQVVKLYYKNGSRNVYTEGTVEAFDADQFSAPYRVQVSIICESPFWLGAEEIVKEISGVVNMFSFPFAIAEEGVEFSTLEGDEYALLHNAGDEATGFVITVYARDNVTGPVIYNAITNEAFRLTGTLEKGHTLTINSNIGSKRVTITNPSGVEINALHRKQAGSVWLQLRPGDNYIAHAATDGAAAMMVTLKYNELFVGV